MTPFWHSPACRPYSGGCTRYTAGTVVSVTTIRTHEIGHAYAAIQAPLADLPRLFYITHQRLSDHHYHSDCYPPIPGKLLATLVLDGAIVWWHGSERRVLRQGDLWLGRYREEGTAYGFDPGEANVYEFLGVIFEGAMAETLVARVVGAYGHVARMDPAHPAVVRLLDCAHRTDHLCDQTASESAGVVLDLLLAVAAAGEHRLRGGNASRTPAQRIEAAVREAADGALDFAGICRHLGLSRSHASRAFTTAYGLSPSRYHHDLRLARICRQLRSDNASLATLAESFGFASASALHRAFVRAMGVTPGRYRTGIHVAVS